MISKSPKRGSFQIECQMKRVEEGTKSIEEATEMIDFYNSFAKLQEEREKDPKWQQDNLEYDLRTTDWILEKTRKSRIYSQNLYAALCNNEFTKNDVWPLLQEKRWSCSWRYAGGIIADMRQQGDYIDWYCSGIQNSDDLTDEQFQQLPKVEQEQWLETKLYVPESKVTDEVKEDLLKLGWLVVEDK